ncbi:MAG: glycosyltransferase family 2 protein [Marmoricola sp.]
MTDAREQDPAFAAPAAPASLIPGPRPTFSVVVAAYQTADVVGAAVAAALAQTEPPLEIVVADDGSTDDLSSALEPYAEAVTLLRLPHRGAAPATNDAVAGVRGDFVAILDADDTWDPRRLARLGDLASSRPDLDLLTTDAFFVVDGNRRSRFYEHNEFATTDQATEILRRTFFFAHVAVRRSRWVELGGFTPDLARGYDWDLQLRLLVSGSAAGCVLEPLADYTIHPQSLSARRWESMQARVDLLDRAASTQPLSPVQRVALAEARERYRRRGVAALTEQRLLDGAPGRRRAALDQLRIPGGARERAFLFAAFVAPGWAGRRLRRRTREHGRASSDRVV